MSTVLLLGAGAFLLASALLAFAVGAFIRAGKGPELAEYYVD